MSITLDTPASERRDGRCVDCGRFTDRQTVHFHGPKRKFSGPPRAHIWDDEGGIVTRCDDVDRARDVLIRKYRRDVDDTPGEAESYFPLGDGQVQRGRWLVQPPHSGYSVLWYRLDDDAKGPGVTTAVVW